MRRRTASVEKKKVKRTSGQVETFRFTLAASDGREFCLELHEGRSVLAGRDLGAEVVIPDGRVSRHHSSLSLEDARLWIEDLHSQNGTLVNNEKIQRALLEDGDSISLGGYELQVTITGQPAAATEEAEEISPAAQEVICTDCSDLDDEAKDTKLELYLGRLADRLEAGFIAAFRVDHATRTIRRLARQSFKARQLHGISRRPRDLPGEFLDGVIETGKAGWRQRDKEDGRALAGAGDAFAAAPVIVGGEVIGLVYTERRTMFEALDIEILSGFCERLTVFFSEAVVETPRGTPGEPAKGFYKLPHGEEAALESSGGIRSEGGVSEVAENLVDTVGDQPDL